MEFKNNFFYELPIEIQDYIFKMKDEEDADDKLKYNFKKCIKGNKKFFNFISNKTFGKIFIDELIKRYRANIYDADGELLNEISRIVVINYVNRFINNCISSEDYQYIIGLIKFKFERQVNSFNSNEYSTFSKRGLKKDLNMIIKYIDSKYYCMLL